MKTGFRKWIAAVCVMAICLAAFPVTGTAAQTVTYTLPVFETSDVHGFLANTATGSEQTYVYRMAYIAGQVNAARTGGDPATTLLLDGGDIYQGHVVSNLQNGEPMVEAFSAMGYDAVGLGNHEFDWDVTTVCDSDGTMSGFTNADGQWVDADIPVLCCNLYDAATRTRVDFTKDYVILDKIATGSDGSTRAVKVAVIGYAEDYSSSIMAAKIAPYLIDTGAVSSVKALAASLKSSGQADAVVVVAHAGANGVAGALANSQVDMVCGGHTHASQAGAVGGVAYIQPTNQAQAYGYAELNFTADGDVSVSGQKTVDVDDSKCVAGADGLDAEVLTLTRRAIAGVAEELNEVIGYITQPVINTATSAGNFVCDLMNDATGSQVAFTNSGGIRTTFELDGATRDITVGDIYTMLPFCNMLYVYRVTYGDLLQSVTRSSLYMSGIDVYRTGNAITALVVDGKCIYKNGTWADGWKNAYVLVSANEYVATGYSPFTTWNAQGKAIDTTSYVDNVTLIAQLKKQAAETDGYIAVDNSPHYIGGSYAGDLVNEKPECDHQYAQTVVAPTCTKDGYTLHTCILCGESYKDTATRALGHDYVENTESSSEYIVVYTCLRCGDSYSTQRPGACPSEAFTDLNTSSWYHEGVDYVLGRGLMAGVGNQRFDPNGTITRAMLVSILYRLDGRPDMTGYATAFEDVEPDRYYAQAVVWGEIYGIVGGTSKTTFSPDAPVTREQIAAFLYRYEKRRHLLSNTASGSLEQFTDAAQVSDYATDAVGWAVGNGIIAGMSTTVLAPRGNATRAQFASMLYRYLKEV